MSLCPTALSHTKCKTDTGTSKQLTYITGKHEWDFSNKALIYIYLKSSKLVQI